MGQRRIGHGLSLYRWIRKKITLDWSRIGGLVMDWQIDIGLAD